MVNEIDPSIGSVQKPDGSGREDHYSFSTPAVRLCILVHQPGKISTPKETRYLFGRRKNLSFPEILP
jgi:hypothetical protein